MYICPMSRERERVGVSERGRERGLGSIGEEREWLC